MSQQEKQKGIVDIVFLIDATGSMAPCIEALKNNINLFIDTLTTKNVNNENPVKDWRARVVGYRDFSADSANWLVDNPFARDAGELKAQLAALAPDGGGDEPESLLDALYKVATMESTDKGASEDARKWRYRSAAARVVVVFTDASYHEKMSIPEAAGGTVDDVGNAVNAGRIMVSAFVPEIDLYDKLAAWDKTDINAYPVGPEGAQAGLEAFTRDKANFERTMKMLAKSISASSQVVPVA
jgi:hypothetical protein